MCVVALLLGFSGLQHSVVSSRAVVSSNLSEVMAPFRGSFGIEFSVSVTAAEGLKVAQDAKLTMLAPCVRSTWLQMSTLFWSAVIF